MVVQDGRGVHGALVGWVAMGSSLPNPARAGIARWSQWPARDGPSELLAHWRPAAGRPMNTTEIFLIALLIVFTVPYLLRRVLRTDDWAPLVVVQIVTGITSGLALGVPLLCGCAAALVLLGSPGWMGPQAANWQFVLGVGMACAVTTLPILILLDWARVDRQVASTMLTVPMVTPMLRRLQAVVVRAG